MTKTTPWGRVDEEGNVFVKDGDGERNIGQYLGGNADEAIEFYTRKFDDLAGQVQILEQRVQAGAKSRDLENNLSALKEQLTSADALGDLQSLRDRLGALDSTIEELAAQEKIEHEQRLEESRAKRTAVVEEMEKLAGTDRKKIRWKDISNTIDQHFSKWQQLQKAGPRLPKAEADELWQRFRTARQTLESEKRAYFSELDQRHKEARQAKTAIVEQAEALVAKGAEGAAEYRRLLQEWKQTPRAGRKHDSALWDRFKAAGDAIFEEKAEIDRAINEEFEENLKRKEELLAKSQGILEITDVNEAKEQWLQFAKQWDVLGRVPRNDLRRIDDEFRKLEQHVRGLEMEHWEKNNPETRARVNDLTEQLQSSLEKLELELSVAEAEGNSRLVKELTESIKAQKQWLTAIEDN